MGEFYGTGIETWDGFGLVGITEKNIWADYEQLLRPGFSSCHRQKEENDNIVASALKSCIK